MLSDTLGTIALPVFAFYLLVACNFIAPIMGCNMLKVLRDNMLTKHIIAFILLVFLIIVASPENADKRVPQIIGLAAFVYTWFFLTTRTHVPVMILVLVSLLIAYIFDIASKRFEKEKNDEELAKAKAMRNLFAVIALSFSLIGFIVYLIEKRREYTGNRFSWSTFFFGNNRCRNFTPKDAKIGIMMT